MKLSTTPEEQVMYSFLEYSIKVLEEQIEDGKTEDGNVDDNLEYERQVKVLNTLKEKIKELKK